jgi:hypothetical protein
MAAAYEPPVSDDRGQLAIRPSWRALGRWEIQVVVLLMSGLAVGSLQIYAKYRSIGWALALAGTGAGFLGLNALYLVAYMTSTSITVTADAILVTHWWRSTASVKPSDIARVVKISVAGDRNAAFGRPAVFAFSSDGRCVLSLYAERWSKVDLDRIWRHLGVTPEGSWDRIILEQDLPVEFPGAF